MSKPDVTKVHPALAQQALANANFDRQKAYSQYIILHFRSTGRLAPNCDNKDLQAYYDFTHGKEEKKDE